MSGGGLPRGRSCALGTQPGLAPGSLRPGVPEAGQHPSSSTEWPPKRAAQLCSCGPRPDGSSQRRPASQPSRSAVMFSLPLSYARSGGNKQLTAALGGERLGPQMKTLAHCSCTAPARHAGCAGRGRRGPGRQGSRVQFSPPPLPSWGLSVTDLSPSFFVHPERTPRSSVPRSFARVTSCESHAARHRQRSRPRESGAGAPGVPRPLSRAHQATSEKARARGRRERRLVTFSAL